MYLLCIYKYLCIKKRTITLIKIKLIYEFLNIKFDKTIKVTKIGYVFVIKIYNNLKFYN